MYDRQGLLILITNGLALPLFHLYHRQRYIGANRNNKQK